MWVVGQRHFPAALPQLKTLYSLYRRLDGSHDLLEQERKIFPRPRFDPRTVQPVACRYTDYAILRHQQFGEFKAWISIFVR
jgi:hypothetical protein